MVETVTDWVMSLDRYHEVTWYETRALVNELVEGMLPVRTRLSPHYGSRTVVHLRSTSRHKFTV